MDELLAKRVGAAAAAGWWTVLISALVMTVQWLFVLLILSVKPEWLLGLWGGGGLTRTTVQNVMLLFVGLFKLILLMLAMACLFLTFWSKRLRKIG